MPVSSVKLLQPELGRHDDWNRRYHAPSKLGERMPSLLFRTQLGLIVVGAMFGCARDQCCTIGGGSASPPPAMVESLPLAEQQNGHPPGLAPDLTRLPDTKTVQAALEETVVEPSYHELTAVEAQCRAAAVAPRANAMLAERMAVQSTRGLGSVRSERSAALQRDLLTIGSVADRNHAAGDALEAFYHLAEAEARGTVLKQTFAANDRALDALRQLTERGLPRPVDEESLQRQRLTYDQRQVELELAITQLNGQLRKLTGYDAVGLQARFLPMLSWDVAVEPVDVDEAISTALALRAELVLLRTLESRLEPDTLPAARNVAATMHGLGVGIGDSCKLAIAFRQFTGRVSVEESLEVSARRRQVAGYRRDSERSVVNEVQQAAASVEAELRRVGLTKDEVASLTDRVRNQEALRQTGGATPFDVNTAELELLRAESDLITRLIAWKIAVVKLKRAQGLLAEECGWGAAGSAGGSAICCP